MNEKNSLEKIIENVQKIDKAIKNFILLTCGDVFETYDI